MASHYFEKGGVYQPPSTIIKSGQVTLTTTPSTIWTPASGKRIVVKGVTLMAFIASGNNNVYISLSGLKLLTCLSYVNAGSIYAEFDGIGLDIAEADEVMTLTNGTSTSTNIAYTTWGYEL